MAVEPSSAVSATRTADEWRMRNLPGYPSPARQRPSSISVASPGDARRSLRRRGDLRRELSAALQRLGDEARRLHLFDECRQIAYPRDPSLRRAHRLPDVLE